MPRSMYRLDKRLEAAMSCLERRLGIRVPLALRQLCVSSAGLELLGSVADDCAVLLPEVLSGDEEVLRTVPEGYLAFMVENEGVIHWAVGLGESEDPPVHVGLDSFDRWTPAHAVFSEWLHARVLDCAVAGDGFRLVGFEVTSSFIGELERRLPERTRTMGYPGDVQYRFVSKFGEVHVLETKPNLSEIYLFPISPEVRFRLLNEAMLPPQVEDRLEGISEEAERALRQWRRRGGGTG